MGYYPIFVEMAGRRVLLVGGGNVAEEKLGKLVDAGADVTIVAPELIAWVQAVVDAGRAAWWPRAYEPGDVSGFELVLIATDDGAVNASVAAAARAQGILGQRRRRPGALRLHPALARQARPHRHRGLDGRVEPGARALAAGAARGVPQRRGRSARRSARRGARAGTGPRPRVRGRLRSDSHAAAAALRGVPEPHPERALAGDDRRGAARAAARWRVRAGAGATGRGARPRSAARGSGLGVARRWWGGRWRGRARATNARRS